jgi:UDP-N-acetylglucosamine--N-acetylmuramyl-(pentapeptide) pyrophosphoryl-undecaprenol N-acetylglucosamine transferase
MPTTRSARVRYELASVTGVVLLVAGGTGGHLFPAQSLAATLAERSWRVHLATDHRVEAYGRDFPAEQIHIIPSATITREPIAAVRGVWRLGVGMVVSLQTVKTVAPAVAVGFGGYPTVPPILAAWLLRVPTVIHEQNGVLGRANRFLGNRATAIATGFPTVAGAGHLVERMVETGNPVRPAVRAAATLAYPERQSGDSFSLLVFGGSQGARFMSDLVPRAIALMPDVFRKRLRITQQCRPEDLARVTEAYNNIGVSADLEPFFRDMPERMAKSHLVVSRAGASTVAELAAIGRPAVMVPLPHALDQDQKANAQILATAGGGWMVEEKDMTPERLASDLAALIEDPARLAAAANAAGTIGRPDAVERLADLVERVAAREPVASLKGHS